MQNQDNHMDELFRKAAEHYPLKTGDSNWDDIAPALTGNPFATPVAGKQTPANKNFKRLLPLLFLLIAGGATTMFFLNNKKEKPTYSSGKVVQVENLLNEKTGNMVSTIQNKPTGEINYSKSITANNTIHTVKINKLINPVLENIVRNGPISNSTINVDDIINNPSTEIAVKNSNEKTEAVNETPPALIITKNETSPAETKQTSNTLIEKENKTAVATTPVIKNKAQKQKGLYAGIIIGAGFSEVKNQGLTKPGLELGLRAGYQFNKTLAVETGFLFARKYYYSDGKYFNMNKVSPAMPAGMQVLSLNGSSAVFEIPVKLKYNILLKNNANFFSTAGLTSYIMTKEKNNYLALINGSKQNITSTYKQANRYFAAAIDLSVGYEFNIQKNKNLRIEPYLQIPLKGIGVGIMPVTSTGLHIGYSLFKH